MTKNILVLFAIWVLFPSVLVAQTPEKMSFQSVIRNKQNQLVTNKTIGIQISILYGTTSGSPVYTETQTPKTNGNGLATFEIGNGTVLNGDLSTIKWADGPFFIKTEIDPEGGSNYSLVNTSQILSVPYALHAKTIDYFDEKDPIFDSWDKSSGITIDESQIIDLKHFTNEDETDPKFNEWDKSSGITIDENQINDLKHFTNEDETDPKFNEWDKSSGITIQESQIIDLKHFTNNDEKDPEFEKSPANNITQTDIQNWNIDIDNTNEIQTLWSDDSKLLLSNGGEVLIDKLLVEQKIDALVNNNGYQLKSEDKDIDASNELINGISLNGTSIEITESGEVHSVDLAPIRNAIHDVDDDTKIQVEKNSDEDIIRADIAGIETLTINGETGTVLSLPTNDENSSLKVKKASGEVVFGVDGQGLLNGDGSGLKNVRPEINYIGGNQRFQITANYGFYNNVRTVTLNAPSKGVCFAMASGYVDWESTGWDLYLGAILCDMDPNSSWSAENEWYSYLNIITDYNCADSSDQYTSFAQHRCIPVNEGDHTFTLWVNKYSSSSKTEVADVNLSVIFFPTGGTGAATIKSAAVLKDEVTEPNVNKRLPRNMDGTFALEQATEQNKRDASPPKVTELGNEIKDLQSENEVLKERLNRIEKLLINKK